MFNLVDLFYNFAKTRVAKTKKCSRRRGWCDDERTATKWWEGFNEIKEAEERKKNTRIN